MPRGTTESGRTRVVITVVLAVLIGAVGAILLPVLIHETKTPAPTTFRAEIGFAVPAGGLPRPGVFRVTATHPDLAPLSVHDVIPQSANEEAVAGLLAGAIRDAGWPENARPRVAGHALSFAAVTGIGGDPGGSGAPMSLSVSGRPGQALTLRLTVTGGSLDPIEEGRIRIGLSARGVVGEDGSTATSGGTSLTTRFVPPRAVLAELLERLRGGGWTAAMEVNGALLLQSLPENSEIGSAILTVEYEGVPDSPYLWSLELLP